MAGAMRKKLVLENGAVFCGGCFGGTEDKIGEVVFCTSMVGIQELITDPVYLDKIVVLTYPVAGCYGINDDDYQSRCFAPAALVARKYCDEPSNFRSTAALGEVMEDNRITGLEGTDTRALTRLLRDEGCCLGMITSEDTENEKVLEAIKAYTQDTRPALRVSCKKRWYSRPSKPEFNVAVIDCGVRNSDIRALKTLGCSLTVLPFDASAEQVKAVKPDGIYISDGPGEPQGMSEAIELIKQLRGEIPICGQGLGFQLICLAAGAQTEKRKTGVYGSNHPILEKKSGKIATCAQSRSFDVLESSLKQAGLSLTHSDVTDGSVQGAENRAERIFGVSYVSGAEEESYPTLFERLTESMREVKANA